MNELLDITKPNKEVIIDKFNAKSGMHIPYEYVELGAMVPVLPATDKVNTVIELIPTLVAPFMNKFHLSYKKMDFSDIFGAPYLEIKSDARLTLYELLLDINQTVGLNLTTDDVDDAPITTDPLEPTLPPKVLIKAKPTSVLYQGEVLLNLDQVLNPPATAISNNDVICVLRKVSGGNDYITAHAFDGYRSSAFKFLQNTDLVSLCKIDNIFSCESGVLVVTGEFSVVANSLSFIDPAVTYKVITVDRVGKILSAREEESILNQVEYNNVSYDADEQCYYAVDTGAVVGQNPKNVYRLFENGTMDGTFIYSNLPDAIVAIIPARLGFFCINRVSTDYFISRFTSDGIVDPNFSQVQVKSNGGVFTTISGFTSYSDTDEETLHMVMSSSINSVMLAPIFTATTVNTEASVSTSAFYSPFFTITDNGETVNASGNLAKYNLRENLETKFWYPKLVKNVLGTSAVYSLNSFNVLAHETVTPLVIGSDAEYSPILCNNEEAENIINLKHLVQTNSGYETYVTVDYIEKVGNPTNAISSAVISFGADHLINGFIATETLSGEEIVSVAVMNR